MGNVVNDSDLSEQTISDGFHVTRIGQNDLMSIQRWVCDPGGSFPEHSHPHQQIGYVYKGEMHVSIEGEQYVLGPGDTYLVDGNEVHAGTNEGDEPAEGVDIFSPPLKDSDWIG
ncbi:cupin domain-containing protein [Natrarchaeobius oligotrophus]|uniref:Cupin domain-containing protein n=1 Tax=Natrarchaeobius chitinivorans TaxID=1679083 RepID=A0A3N6NJV2_NATCH|nr:cupin domain-containing protein [Natrarchaeobius chitinivorans]RQG99422.1 cupin domain-containing protein [Natrarchaeobius chitinivorans]